MGFQIQCSLLVACFDACGGGLLTQQGALELSLSIFKAGLRRLEGKLRFLDGLLQIRVAQLQNDGVGRNLRTRPQQDALDPPLGGGRNPPDVFRDERAGPADLAQHLPPLHAVDPDGSTLDGRRRRLEPRHPDRHEDDGNEGRDTVGATANLLLAGDAWRPCDINHGTASVLNRVRREPSQSR